MIEKKNRCTRCVISSELPTVTFDEDGVCSFCRDQMFFAVDDAVIEQARRTVEQLLASEKRGGDYDAIVCYSGGKDSIYTLQLATRQYGLKVLAFTFDNGFLSGIANENICRVTEALGIDHITFRPSQKNLRAIIRASALHPIYNPRTLMRISAGCKSCISIVNNTALTLALEKGAPFIIAGFTPGQIPANGIVFRNNYRFLEESREAPLQKLAQIAGPEVVSYFRIPERLLSSIDAFPHTINLLCLENITEQQILEQIKPLGWVQPRDVDGCSSNCRLNALNNYVHHRTLGYSPYELELSHLIRKGQLTRQEALEKLGDEQRQERDTIMRELDITESAIDTIAAVFKKKR